MWPSFDLELMLIYIRLQEKVIDIEVANHTPSPTVDPSVRVILVGHSMGGIVAADTLLALTSDLAIDAASSDSKFNSFMFPYIQGVLAFDTPYLGISPGVVAHGAEEHYNTASSALTQLSGLSGMLWGGSTAAAAEKEREDKKAIAALPAPPPKDAPVPAWQKWGKIAMYAGAAGAVAAGGAAAYMKRDQITESWSWVGSHLEFVGCLLKGEELKKRVSGVVNLNRELDVGFANIYTRLGQKAKNQQGGMVGSVTGNQRTFCNLPKKDAMVYFHQAINDAASDETWAHMSRWYTRLHGSLLTNSTAMFFPKDNPGYYAMSEEAKTLAVKWTKNSWYESSTGDSEVLTIDNEL